MDTDLAVGIIGVSAEGGWARESHVPAVQATDGLRLAAVATRTRATADAAAAAFGVPRAYDDPTQLIADPDIDVVTIAAPVPAHHDLILAALAAGKHVLTEWPVGTCTGQTVQLADAARRSGLHTVVNLQARANPSVTRARELITSGAVGRVLHVSVHSSTAGWGRHIGAGELYLEDPANGMTLATIQTAHTLDVAVLLCGPLASLSALATTQFPQVRVETHMALYARTVADHLLLHGRFADGGALAVQVVGGRPTDDTPFRLTVTGETGEVVLNGGAPRGFQSGRLHLTLDGHLVHVDDPTAGLPDPVANVAGTYAALRDDIRGETHTAPDFTHAVRLSHLVDDLEASAASVMRTAEYPGGAQVVIAGRSLNDADVDALELDRARHALAYLKGLLGDDAVRHLVSEGTAEMQRRVRGWVEDSAGRWASASIELVLPAPDAAGFDRWYSAAMATGGPDGQEPALRSGHPEHFVSRPWSDGPPGREGSLGRVVEVIENIGETDLPWRVLYRDLPDGADPPSPWDEAFPHRTVLELLDGDGVRIGFSMRQLRDAEDGLHLLMTSHLPIAAPEQVLGRHLHHFAIEYRNWARLAAARSSNHTDPT